MYIIVDMYTCIHVYVCFLASGSKSGAGLDDSVSGKKSYSLPPPGPRVHSTKPAGTAKSKFEVHVQINGANHILVILNRTRCGP